MVVNSTLFHQPSQPLILRCFPPPVVHRHVVFAHVPHEAGAGRPARVQLRRDGVPIRPTRRLGQTFQQLVLVAAPDGSVDGRMQQVLPLELTSFGGVLTIKVLSINQSYYVGYNPWTPLPILPTKGQRVRLLQFD